MFLSRPAWPSGCITLYQVYMDGGLYVRAMYQTWLFLLSWFDTEHNDSSVPRGGRAGYLILGSSDLARTDQTGLELTGVDWTAPFDHTCAPALALALALDPSNPPPKQAS